MTVEDICEKCLKAGKPCGPKVFASEKPEEASLQTVVAEPQPDADDVFLQFVDTIIRMQEGHSSFAQPHLDPNKRILHLAVATFRIQKRNPNLNREQLAQGLRIIESQIGQALDMDNTENPHQWEEGGDAEKDESGTMDEIWHPNSTHTAPPQYRLLGGEQLGHIARVEHFPNTGHSPLFPHPQAVQSYQTQGSYEHPEMDMTSVQLTSPVEDYMNPIDHALGVSTSSAEFTISPHNPPVARQVSGVSYPKHPISNVYNPRVIYLN